MSPRRPLTCLATRHHTHTQRREQIWNLNTPCLPTYAAATCSPLIPSSFTHLIGKLQCWIEHQRTKNSSRQRLRPANQTIIIIALLACRAAARMRVQIPWYHVSPSPIYPSLTQPLPAARCASPPASCAPLRCLSSSRPRHSCPLPPSLPPPPPAR